MFFFLSIMLAYDSWGADTFTSERLMAPCQSASAPANGCMVGMPRCSTVLEPLLTSVKTTVKNRVDGLYEDGIDKDVFLDGTSALFGKPVCAAGGIHTFNIATEGATNHVSENCGAPAGIHVGGGSPRSISVTAVFTNGEGTREAAHFRGLFAASLGCQLDQVFAEARSSSGIRVSTSCQALAQDIKNLSTEQMANGVRLNQVFTNSYGLARYFCAQADMQRGDRVPEMCSAENSGQTGGLNPEMIQHRNSACLLATASAALLAAYGNFVACEVFNRATTHYASTIYGNSAPLQDELRNYFASLAPEVSARCRKRRYLLFWKRRGRACVRNAIADQHNTRVDSLFSDIQSRYFEGDKCRL